MRTAQYCDSKVLVYTVHSYITYNNYGGDMFGVCLLLAVMKKVKHRLVEKMKDSTADTLGLSRAVLVNG